MKLITLWTGILVCTSGAHAQETRGQILGRVTYESGAVVAGARIKAVNAATNVPTSSVTNESADGPASVPHTRHVAKNGPRCQASGHSSRPESLCASQTEPLRTYLFRLAKPRSAYRSLPPLHDSKQRTHHSGRSLTTAESRNCL